MLIRKNIDELKHKLIVVQIKNKMKKLEALGI